MEDDNEQLQQDPSTPSDQRPSGGGIKNGIKNGAKEVISKIGKAIKESVKAAWRAIPIHYRILIILIILLIISLVIIAAFLISYGSNLTGKAVASTDSYVANKISKIASDPSNKDSEWANDAKELYEKYGSLLLMKIEDINSIYNEIIDDVNIDPDIKKVFKEEMGKNKLKKD